MTVRNKGGRPSIFTPKDGTKQYRILALTLKGEQKFEAFLRKLGKLADWPSSASPGDGIDYLVRSDAEVARDLQKRAKEE